jgi:hypothetical protein
MSLYTFIHNLLNVLVQIANKMGLQKICIRVHICTDMRNGTRNEFSESVFDGFGLLEPNYCGVALLKP